MSVAMIILILKNPLLVQKCSATEGTPAPIFQRFIKKIDQKHRFMGESDQIRINWNY